MNKLIYALSSVAVVTLIVILFESFRGPFTYPPDTNNVTDEDIIAVVNSTNIRDEDYKYRVGVINGEFLILGPESEYVQLEIYGDMVSTRLMSISFSKNRDPNESEKIYNYKAPDYNDYFTDKEDWK